MEFERFERRAHELFGQIPEGYRAGVDALVVRREALPHPALPEVYTLGHCLTDDHPSEVGGPETTRSLIVLYWGSFLQLAALDREFDWEDELWETLTHELRHHLESLARDDRLEGVDYAADQTFRREEGLAFDPWYFQRGDPMGGGYFRVERDYYLEWGWNGGSLNGGDAIEFAWHGRRYRFPRPTELGDVHFVWIDGIDLGPATLQVVLVRRTGFWEGVMRMLGRRAPTVRESAALAEPVPALSDEG